MTVELISVGTELLLGNIVNTNANYLAIQCAGLGFSMYHQVTVGDNKDRLYEAIDTARHRADIIILTGGLGPTSDDITKETLASLLNKELIMDEYSKDRIMSYFKNKITENNWKQALKIKDSLVIDNDNGTAPGYIVEDKNNVFVLLPGPPREMIPMFEDKMLPYLQKLQDKVFLSRMVKTCGIGEAKAETMIIDLINNQTNPTIAPYAKNGEVHFRVTASANSSKEAEQLLEPVISQLQARFANNIYSLIEEETLEEVVVRLLSDHNLTLSCAESCTGGLVAGRIINVAGVSDIFTEGFITYSNQAKMKYLNVKESTLKAYGAVSEQVAKEMAIGAAKASSSNVSVAITGIAGPGGGTEEKPVGLVYISCFIDGDVFVNKYNFRGNREKVREQSVIAAIDLIRRCIVEIYG
ncbi:MAG: competence/damage-inducible protein A [Clostridiales bacterium]|nr:competence/damage-inducible protein A [Clostridiales bacterium]